MTDRRLARVLLGLFCAFAALYLAFIPFHKTKNLFASDAMFYYAYLPAVTVDGSLDLRREYAFYQQATGAAQPDGMPLWSGRVHDPFPVGPAILWSPFYLAGHAAAVAVRGLGLPVRADGFGLLEEIPVGLGGMAYGLLGIWLAYLVTRRVFPAAPATQAALGVLLASGAVYYTVIEPFMSHAVGWFTVALFLYVWDRTRGAGRTLGQWAALGALASLATMVRFESGLLLVLPALEAAVWLWRGTESRGRILTGAGVAAVCAVTVFVPELVALHAMYGNLGSAFSGAGGVSGFVTWGSPHLTEVLFSLRHGLFIWTPILLPAVIGVAALVRRDAVLFWGSALVLCGQWYLCAVRTDWWAGFSFGNRRFLDVLPFFILGLAGFCSWLPARWRRRPTWAALAALAAFNTLFVVQYRFGFIPMSDTITWRQLTLDKLLLPWNALTQLLHHRL